MYKILLQNKIRGVHFEKKFKYNMVNVSFVFFLVQWYLTPFIF